MAEWYLVPSFSYLLCKTENRDFEVRLDNSKCQTQLVMGVIAFMPNFGFLHMIRKKDVLAGWTGEDLQDLQQLNSNPGFFAVNCFDLV